MVYQFQNWQKLATLVEISSPWLKIIAEKLEDNQGQVLDYWRVEKVDSVIAIALHSDQVLLPMASYRPGLGKITLDFAGGRLESGQQPISAVSSILHRELGIVPSQITDILPINSQGWAVDSSFSNQKLYGFVVYINPEMAIDSQLIGTNYPATEIGIKKLLEDLTCLQCRSLLLEAKYQGYI